MALLINAADPLGSANANTIDNNLRTLKTAIEDIFGVPDNTTIGAEGFTFNSGGLRRVKFQDAAGDPGTAGFLQRNGTALKFHNGSARTLYMQGGSVAVADGGTGIGSGTSGGILAFTGSTTLASSAALTQRGLVFGGGAGVAPGSMSALTNGQLPIGRTSNSPTGATITAGANAAVTNASGGITLAGTDRVLVSLAGIADNVSTYFIGGFIGSIGAGISEAIVALPSPATGTIAALYVRGITAEGGTVGATCTLRVAGADTSLIANFSMPTSTEGSGLATGSVSVTRGDLLSVRVNLDTSADLSSIRATFAITATA